MKTKTIYKAAATIEVNPVEGLVVIRSENKEAIAALRTAFKPDVEVSVRDLRVPVEIL